MTKHPSISERKILHALSANGGEYFSLFRLAVELKITYKTAWINTLRLSWSGYLAAERITTRRGRPYKLHLTYGPSWPMALMGQNQEIPSIVGGSNLAVSWNSEHGTREARP